MNKKIFFTFLGILFILFILFSNVTSVSITKGEKIIEKIQDIKKEIFFNQKGPVEEIVAIFFTIMASITIWPFIFALYLVIGLPIIFLIAVFSNNIDLISDSVVFITNFPFYVYKYLIDNLSLKNS